MTIPIHYSLRNLSARKVTTALTAGGMALVVFVFTAMQMLDAGLQKTLVQTGSPDNMLVIRKGSETEVQSGVSRAQASIIESLAGIVAQQLLKTKDGLGRVAALELLVGSSAISSLIREGKTFQITSVLQGGQNVGMQTMDMALERLMTQNRITPESALEVATDKEAFGRVVARVRPDLVDPAS